MANNNKNNNNTYHLKVCSAEHQARPLETSLSVITHMDSVLQLTNVFKQSVCVKLFPSSQ